jgi:hypothetical protein
VGPAKGALVLIDYQKEMFEAIRSPHVATDSPWGGRHRQICADLPPFLAGFERFVGSLSSKN